ncbi:MAG: 6-hydroxymethylpterin diphosphokinase MptE-like protein [Kofleriaceae bacterium]
MSAEQLAAPAAALEELGATGRALIAAIEADDVVAALAASHAARAARARLARLEPPDDVEPSLEGLRALQALAGPRADARLAEQAFDRWLARPVAGDRELLRTPLGVATIADRLLPAVWDVATDLVVLVGAELGAVAGMLGALGQRRVVALVAADADAGGYPPEVIVCRDLRELVAAIRTMDPCAPERLAVRAGLDVDAATAEDALARVREALADLRIHRNTIEAFSPTWIAQGAANLPALARHPTIDAIGDRLAGRPLVIVAPGPSLAANVARLRELDGAAVIVAVSHALRPLRQAGVRPDVVLTVDPQDVRYHFADVDLRDVGAIVNGVTVHPSLFSLDAPVTMAVAANSTLDAWLLEGLGADAAIASGGSVATSAFGLALRWRCDPIVCVGLDLSFSGTQYYVASCADGDARAELGPDGTVRVGNWSAGFRAMKAAGGPAAPAERLIELPGWHGTPVRSTFMFGMFHRWFVEVAARLTDPAAATPAPRMYNCTEGGAFIAGMAHRPLADVVAELRGRPALDARAMFAEVAASHDAVGARRRLAAHLRRQLGRLATIRRLATRCLAEARRSDHDRGGEARLARHRPRSRALRRAALRVDGGPARDRAGPRRRAPGDLRRRAAGRRGAAAHRLARGGGRARGAAAGGARGGRACAPGAGRASPQQRLDDARGAVAVDAGQRGQAQAPATDVVLEERGELIAQGVVAERRQALAAGDQPRGGQGRAGRGLLRGDRVGERRAAQVGQLAEGGVGGGDREVGAQHVHAQRGRAVHHVHEVAVATGVARAAHEGDLVAEAGVAAHDHLEPRPRG